MSESCLVSRLERYMALSEDESDFVAKMERDERPMRARTTIVRQGQRTPDIMVLKFGWAVVRSRVERGRAQILRIYLPGDVIGLAELGSTMAPHAIEMQTDGAICPFPRDRLAQMYAAAPRLSALLTALSSLDQISMRDSAFALTRLTAEERLIDFLLRLQDRLTPGAAANGARVYLPFNQSELGEALGLTSVYVNKLLRKLVGEGRLSVDRPYVRLLDRPGMEAEVGFRSCYEEIDQSWFPEVPA